MQEPKFFNPFAEILKTANHLPHWQQPGATYFITFRLGDSMPAALLKQWLRERDDFFAQHPKPWSMEIENEHRTRFTLRFDQWIDAGHGECSLRDPSVRAILEECLRFFDGVRYDHHAWVIMPNHVHALTTLRPEWTLEQVVGTWKSFTANRIHQHLGRAGILWQEDYFDRLIRDTDHFTSTARYIWKNPVRAKLREDEFTLHLSDLAMERGLLGPAQNRA